MATTGTRAGTARRQYCWWITFTAPFPATAARLQLRSPAEFTRESFRVIVCDAHTHAGNNVEEVAIFLELHQRVDAHGNRVPHLNALVRCTDQYAWCRK